MYRQENAKFLELRSCTYEISWRLNMLIVRPAGEKSTKGFALLKGNRKQITDCLIRSPVQRVKLDPKLSKTDLLLWADACHTARKVAFLRLPKLNETAKKNKPLLFSFSRAYNSILATTLLIVLSPLLLAISIRNIIVVPQKLFEHTWKIGYRGELFLDFNFFSLDDQRKDISNIFTGQKIELYLMNSPQLLSVIRGKSKLFGCQPAALEQISSLDPAVISNLNRCPGIWGTKKIANLEIDLNKKVAV